VINELTALADLTNYNTPKDELVKQFAETLQELENSKESIKLKYNPLCIIKS
jgi:hypothetical protein